MAAAPKKQAEEPQKAELAVVSERFLANVQQQFAAEMGGQLEFSDLERVLTQHLFLKVDTSLKEFEKKRLSKREKDKPAFTWTNINLQKMALDTVHRVSLGLDALVQNHIWPIPYLNGRTKKYDLDLRIGYIGEDMIRRRDALDPPVDIRYELVHESDHFKALKKDANRDVESYEFTISNEFDRGKIIGGFGYIVQSDPTKNQLVIVTERDFQKAINSSKGTDFWGTEGKDGDEKWRDEMKYKTVVRRTCKKIGLDPAKINSASFAYAEAQAFEADEQIAAAELEADANAEVIDMEPEPEEDVTEAEVEQEVIDIEPEESDE